MILRLRPLGAHLVARRLLVLPVAVLVTLALRLAVARPLAPALPLVLRPVAQAQVVRRPVLAIRPHLFRLVPVLIQVAFTPARG